MRGGRPLLSVMTMSHPQSYEILLVPAFTDGKGTADQGAGTEDSDEQDSDVKNSDVQDPGTGDADSGDAGSDDDGAGDSGAEGDEDDEDLKGAEGAHVSGSRDTGNHGPGAAIRSAVVAATGQTGESGYPRYEGDGMVADIDPATHTVEALLIDGSELDYGLTVRISERKVDG